MVHAETTKRSTLDADHLIGSLQARGVAQLRGEAAIWVLVDGSDLRKPHAQTMEHLQRVKRLDGQGTVPGYRTLNAIGVGRQRRGLLYHRLFSSAATDFLSESAETQAALASIGRALAPLTADITYVFDSGFDDVAVWGTVWTQRHHLVCRVHHRDRLVRPAADQPRCPLSALAPRLQPLARVETEMVVRKGQQARPKLQPVTAVIAAVPLVVSYQEEVRTRPDGAQHDRQVWLVEVRLDGAREEPWWLLTDRPVTTAEEATEIFRMYRQRWSIEDAFKVGKQCLGWEEVRVLTLDAVRTLVALGWVAAGFLYELGVTLEWAEVRLLARLGGGEVRASRPPGKLVLTRGLRRLLDHLATEAILTDEIQQHGSLPPRIAALLGRADSE
jgi:Transposase DDE domain